MRCRFLVSVTFLAMGCTREGAPTRNEASLGSPIAQPPKQNAPTGPGDDVAPGPNLIAVDPPAACQKSATSLKYPAVRAAFENHCARCHDHRQSDNEDAQKVFEASSYPFSTERPETLLEDLVGMFEDRDGLSDDERCQALNWIASGGLDADGNAPVWRKPSATR